MTDDSTPSPFDEFIRRGWQDHGDDPAGVMDRFPEGIGLVGEPDHLGPMAALIVHVSGEHLGRWDDGLALLGHLEEKDVCDPTAPSGQAVLRSRAILHLCAGDEAAYDACVERGHPTGDLPPESTRARTRAIAAAALAGQGRIEEANARFREALDFAAYGPERGDPAAIAIAITGNNLACELETRSDRGPEEDELLETAAQAGRRYWEIAGDWKNVKIAEYRLAMTYLALGRPEDARTHAELSLGLCDANEGGPGDRFFCHEALARVHHARGDADAARTARNEAESCLSGVREDMREYATGALTSLDELLAG